jgi:hypothetical protein
MENIPSCTICRLKLLPRLTDGIQIIWRENTDYTSLPYTINESAEFETIVTSKDSEFKR